MSKDNLLSENKEIFVLLSLGANLGNPRITIKEAINYLIANQIINKYKIASYYETEPVGFSDQPWFLNTAISGYTNLSLNQLINHCKNIEYLLGRINRERWHEREIDIDIIFYGNQTYNNKSLSIPHPRMHQRKFVLIPAAEIAGNFIHPELKLSINELLKICNDTSNVRLSA